MLSPGQEPQVASTSSSPRACCFVREVQDDNKDGLGGGCYEFHASSPAPTEASLNRRLAEGVPICLNIQINHRLSDICR
jgi:hypothetical protein